MYNDKRKGVTQIFVEQREMLHNQLRVWDYNIFYLRLAEHKRVPTSMSAAAAGLTW